MLSISESYIIGVDISSDDEPLISVAKCSGTNLIYTNTIVGEDAKQMYEQLTNKKLERMSTYDKI